MSESDIYLDKSSIVADCHQFKINGEDLVLASRYSDRNSTKTQKRALVNYLNDTLVVNFNNDYKVTELTGRVVQKTVKDTASFSIENSRGKTSTFITNGVIKTTGDIRLPIHKYITPEDTPNIPNLDEIKDLRNQNDSLLRTLRWMIKRIDKLEEKQGVTPPSFPTTGQLG